MQIIHEDQQRTIFRGDGQQAVSARRYCQPFRSGRAVP